MPVADVGAPDERQHANYVLHLLQGKGFPILKPGDPNLYETYQSHQPPLYYLIAAGWTRLAAADLEQRSGGTWLRLLNTLIGLITVCGIYCAARWGLDSQPVAVGAAAIGALMPMFVALHSAVSNDPLLFAFCTWTLALLAQAIRQGPSPRLAWAVAVLAGLGLLTKTSALALIPTALVGFHFACATHRADGAMKLHRVLIILLAPLLLASPWLLRNQALYGDPLAMSAFKEAFLGSAQRADLVAMIAATREAKGLSPGGASIEYWTQWFGWWTLRSFFGAFGQMDIFLGDAVYRILAGASALLGIGWVFALLRRSEGLASDSKSRAFHATAATLLVVVALLFLQFNLTYFQAQARYLYPAVGAIASGLSVGAAFLFGRRRDWAPFVLVSAFAVLNLHVLSVLTEQFARRTL